MSPNLTLYQADHGLFILTKMHLYVLCGMQYAQTILIIWMRARGRCLVPFSATFHLIPYFHLIIVTGSHWTWRQTGRQSFLGILLFIFPTSLGVQMCESSCLPFYMDTCDSNSGSYAYKTSTLSSRSYKTYFFFKIF